MAESATGVRSWTITVCSKCDKSQEIPPFCTCTGWDLPTHSRYEVRVIEAEPVVGALEGFIEAIDGSVARGSWTPPIRAAITDLRALLTQLGRSDG